MLGWTSGYATEVPYALRTDRHSAQRSRAADDRFGDVPDAGCRVRGRGTHSDRGRVPAGRHGRGLRQRGRCRAGSARLGIGPEGPGDHHQVQPKMAQHSRGPAGVAGQHRTARGRVRRPAAGALAQPGRRRLRRRAARAAGPVGRRFDPGDRGVELQAGPSAAGARRDRHRTRREPDPAQPVHHPEGHPAPTTTRTASSPSRGARSVAAATTCARTRCWSKWRDVTARRRPRWCCAGTSSRAWWRSPSRATRSGSRRTSTCSTSS